MADFARNGKASVEQLPDPSDFAAIAITEAQTLAAIRDAYMQFGYVADPHTAVGLAAAHRLRAQVDAHDQLVSIATAHPAKFPEAVAQALDGKSVTHPRLEALRGLPPRVEQIEPDLELLKAYVRKHGSS